MKEKSFNRIIRLSLAVVCGAFLSQSTPGQQIFYSENFESPDSTNNWNINLGSARDLATFAFDYSTIGIPPAPGGTTTLGLKLQANRPVATGAKSGVSVSPKNQSFTGNYVLEFDVWENFPGPAPDGGSGSTQLTGAGIMTSGTAVNFDGTGDALSFAVTGESGATFDFQTYFNGIVQTDTTLFTAGGRGHELAYYQTNFPGGVTAPAAQLAQYSSQTGATRAGTVGWKWRHVRITKLDNIVTWDIDNIRIATVNLTDNGIETLGGNDFLLMQSDINNGTTSAALEPLLFGLFDNVRVTSVPPKVSAIQTDPNGGFVDTLPEGDTATVAAFKIVRPTDDVTAPLNVNFTLAGTATRGDAASGDYFIRTNGVIIPTATTVTIPAGSDNVLVEIVANEDNVSELAETIIFNLASASAYVPEPPIGGTVTITDNDAASVDISALVFNQMFEGNTNDLIRVTLERRGDVNAGPFDVNLNYGGTATADSDYTKVATATFNPGDVNVTVDIHPLNDSATEDRETVTISIATGTGYNVGTNNVLTAGATGVIVDDDVPEGTILFKEDFLAGSEANWTVLFGSVLPDLEDYTATFGVDYTLQPPDGPGLPPAPHAGTETMGLLMSVNKLDGTLAAAGVNAYLNGQDFTGNYALRFDMYLMQNASLGTTENALFGINHDGTKTNWYSNATNNVPSTSEYDGVWASVVADASSLPGDPRARDYQIFTAPGVTLGGLFGPTLAASRESPSFADVFHRPPWSPGSAAGSPGNSPTSATPSWAQVELRQVNGIVTLTINNTNILSYTNSTASTHGKIMLGYDDAYNSIGSGGGGFVVYDNLRVVRLEGGVAADIQISNNITVAGNNVTIDFTAGPGEPTTAFKLVSADNVAGPYVDDNTATITSLGGSSYRATTTATGTMRFYQIRRAP